MNLIHIAEGWGKSLHLLDVSEEDKEVSQERMNICAECPNAKESQFLKFIKKIKAFEEMDGIYCNLCKCPINEKSLVKGEACPIGMWNK